MRYDILNILFDIFALIISFILSLFIRFKFMFDNIDLNWYIISFIIILLIDLLMMFFKGLYDNKQLSLIEQIRIVFNSLMYSIASYIIISYFIKNTLFSRLTLGYLFISILFLQLTGKLIIEYIRKENYKKGKGLINTLVIGSVNDHIERLLYDINSEHEYGLNIIKTISNIKSNEKNILESVDFFKDYIVKKDIKSVIFTSKVDNIDRIINYCLNNYINVYVIGNIENLMNYPVEIIFIDDIPILKIKDILISGISGKLKRLIDILLSLTGLIILSPVFLIIIFLIKVTSKGPVFFKHRRLGLNGKIINVYKFRSMVVNAEEKLKSLLESDPEFKEEYYRSYKLKKDPRLTKIGCFLRKTSLDELPQLFNVLKGDMSLVGPRPIVENEISKYGEYAKYLLRVPPGVTGFWQVSGRNDIDYEERVKMDMQYILNWNIWLDINILFKTIPAVLKKDGAY